MSASPWVRPLVHISPVFHDLLLYLALKLQRVRNPMKGLFGAAGAAHDDRAEIQYATENTLRDTDAFDFTQQCFQ